MIASGFIANGANVFISARKKVRLGLTVASRPKGGRGIAIFCSECCVELSKRAPPYQFCDLVSCHEIPY